MALFNEVATLIPALRDRVGPSAGDSDVRAVLERMPGDTLVEALRQADTVVREAERLRLLLTGAIAARSRRENGHDGLAQSHGHRTSTTLIQEITGSTQREAARTVRVGEALFEHAAAVGQGTDPSADPTPIVPTAPDWHTPIDDALVTGAISSAQHDVIRRCLGEPPVGDDRIAVIGGEVDGVTEVDLAGDATALRNASIMQAWSVAAAQLVDEASHRTVEELGRAARTIRDRLDPEGAAERFAARYDARSWRDYRDQDGRLHAHIVFDDEGAAWVESVSKSVFRPRRGGVRFVEDEERMRADAIAADPRTDEQLAYDLFLDLIRAGTLADAKTVFGSRQAGVRIVSVVDSPQALLEDEGVAVPAAAAEQLACNAGRIAVTVDRRGDPLRLGRIERLFTSAQRLALAVRDGGCRWRGCDRPPSYCEAHHIDEWADGGSTDIDRGILLCRFHHMQLHHGEWRITRDGVEDFLLHSPRGEPPAILKPRLALGYTWADLAPPPGVQAAS